MFLARSTGSGFCGMYLPARVYNAAAVASLDTASPARARRARRRARVHSRSDRFESQFSTTFRHMPTANAEGKTESEGGIGKVSARRVSSYLQIDRAVSAVRRRHALRYEKKNPRARTARARRSIRAPSGRTAPSRSPPSGSPASPSKAKKNCDGSGPTARAARGMRRRRRRRGYGPAGSAK